MAPPAGATTDRRDWPAVVVGGGPAGLATSRELKRRGIAHVVLERGERVGAVWTQLYDSLVLHTGRHLSALPGLPMPRSVPLFPKRSDVIAYLADYAQAFGLPVATNVDVARIEPGSDRWCLTTSAGAFTARALVMATGIVSSPRIAHFAGEEDYRGRLVHSRAYRRPADVPGQRVLVVGVGNSGGEIAAELAQAGRTVDVAVRSGANVVPLTLAGIPIQYFGHFLLKLPRPLGNAIARGAGRLVELRRGPSPLPRAAVAPLEAIPLIGFHLVDAIRAGRIGVRPGIARLTAGGAMFTDGTSASYEAIILATGYRAALEPLGDLIRRDARGNAIRTDRVTSGDQQNLYFVGLNQDASGGLRNIAVDAPLAARKVAQTLAMGAKHRADDGMVGAR